MDLCLAPTCRLQCSVLVGVGEGTGQRAVAMLGCILFLRRVCLDDSATAPSKKFERKECTSQPDIIMYDITDSRASTTLDY